MATQAAAASTQEVIEMAKQAHESLRSTRCQCGGKKREDQSFCMRCYHKLPGDMRANLWVSFRDGYAKHYAAAKQFLEELKARPTRATA